MGFFDTASVVDKTDPKMGQILFFWAPFYQSLPKSTKVGHIHLKPTLAST